jgi:hypothetical protein
MISGKKRGFTARGRSLGSTFAQASLAAGPNWSGNTD